MPTHRVWRLSWRDPDHGNVQEWFETRRVAEVHLKVKGEEQTAWLHPVDIPKSRAGLVRWLNAHFDTDNG